MLIGFSGKRAAGKDTAANYLIKLGFEKRAFADPLKNACKELFLLSDSQLNGTQQDKESIDNRWFGCTPRMMMQYVGTDLLRNRLNGLIPGIGNDLFIHNFGLWYDEKKKNNPKSMVVVTDVRFRNEVEMIHSRGGIVIKLERANGLPVDSHESEISIDNITDIDYVIDNNGSLSDLYNSLQKIVNI